MEANLFYKIIFQSMILRSGRRIVKMLTKLVVVMSSSGGNEHRNRFLWRWIFFRPLTAELALVRRTAAADAGVAPAGLLSSVWAGLPSSKESVGQWEHTGEKIGDLFDECMRDFKVVSI